MIIDFISDLHGFKPNLPGGDLLIVCGDLTTKHSKKEALDFIYWLAEQDYKEKIVIAGNHDTFLIDETWFVDELECISNSRYLCDSGTEFEGLKLWGSPWTQTFPNMNPHCMAFTCDTDEELAEKWRKIPDNLDILVTHSPPHGIFDSIKNMSYGFENDYSKHTGSVSLRNHVIGRIKPRIHCFGHIHEHGGKVLDTVTTKFINCSHVNEHYQPVNKSVRIIL